MKWKYVEALKNKNAIIDFLNEQEISLPDDIITFISEHNAGSPENNRFDTNVHKECVFNEVPSYNEDDPGNIYGIYAGELRDVLRKHGLFPIAIDPGGDLICVDMTDQNKIVLLRTENDRREFISENIDGLLNKLY